jgi:phosphoglycolate phosphatase-like HAD superfamily hydrolase
MYVRSCPDLQDCVCPGVRTVLGRLKRRGFLVGLVTGNLTRIGWKKMERSGLKTYFHFGMFAEMGATRADLVGLAKREATRQGWISPQAPISLVGDHQNDVDAAKVNQVRAIAVATGLSSKEALAAHSPDVLLDDLRQLRLGMLL